MTKSQYDILLKRIRDIYPEFKVDEIEWWEQLKDYSYDDVSRNLHHHSGVSAPIYSQLIRGAKKDTQDKDMTIQCDLCKQWIHYTDWNVYDTHWRRCSKIDFINRQAKELEGKGIDYEFYNNMTNDELDKRYRKIMDHWEATHKREPNKLFQKL